MKKQLSAISLLLLAASVRGAPAEHAKVEQIPILGDVLKARGAEQNGIIATTVANVAANRPDITATLIQDWIDRTDRLSGIITNRAALKDSTLQDLLARETALRGQMDNEILAAGAAASDFMERHNILDRLPIIGGAGPLQDLGQNLMDRLPHPLANAGVGSAEPGHGLMDRLPHPLANAGAAAAEPGQNLMDLLPHPLANSGVASAASGQSLMNMIPRPVAGGGSKGTEPGLGLTERPPRPLAAGASADPNLNLMDMLPHPFANTAAGAGEPGQSLMDRIPRPLASIAAGAGEPGQSLMDRIPRPLAAAGGARSAEPPVRERISQMFQDGVDIMTAGPEIFQRLMADRSGPLREIIAGRAAAIEDRWEGRIDAAHSLLAGGAEALVDINGGKAARAQVLAARLAAEEAGEAVDGALSSLKDYATEFVESTGFLRGAEDTPRAWESMGLWPPAQSLRDHIRELTTLEPQLMGLFQHLQNPKAAPVFATLNELFEEISAGGRIQSIEGLDGLIKPFKAFGAPLDVELAVSNACLAFLDTVFPA